MFIKYSPNFKILFTFKRQKSSIPLCLITLPGLNHHTPFLSFTDSETTNSIEVINKTFTKYRVRT